MKKSIVFSAALLTLLSLSTAGFASPATHGEKERPTERPTSARSFTEAFGNIPVDQWSNLKDLDVARFKKDGMIQQAYFNGAGELVGSTHEVKYDELPADARKHISKYFKGYSPVRVIMYDDNENSESVLNLYGTDFHGKDNYFIEMSKDGKKIVLESDLMGAVRFFSEMK